MVSRIKSDSYVRYFILTILLGFTPLLWFKGLPIAGEEFYALDYAKWGQLFAGSWFNAVNWGEYSPLSSFKFQGELFTFLYFLGMSKYIALVFWHTSLFLISGVCMYGFLYKLFERKYSSFLYFIATSYYLFSPYFLNISITLSPPRIFYALLPALFMLILDMYRKSTIGFNKLVLLNLILLVGSPIMVNIPLGLVLLGVVYLSLIFMFLSARITWKKSIITLSLFTMIYLALNIWWLLPTAYKQFSQSGDVKAEASAFVTYDKTPTVDAISLFGSWAFREKIANTDYYYFPYFKSYDDFPGSLVRYLPYYAILIGLLGFTTQIKTVKKTYKDNFLYFIFLLHVVFLFLSKGTAEPFGFVYKILYDKAPLFWMYREPYAKFMPVVAFTAPVILVYGAGYLLTSVSTRYNPVKYKHLKLLKFSIGTSSLLVFVLFYAKPFFDGSVIWGVNDGPQRSHRINIPDGWEALQKDWKPSEGYYYQFPSADIYDAYNWDSGYNGNPYLLLTNAKLLNPEKGYSTSENPQRKYITSYLYGLIINDPQKFISVAPRYNVSGLILQRDTVYNNFKYAFEVIKNNYSNIIAFENPHATIYQVPGEHNELINVANAADIININEEQLAYYHLIREVTEDARLISVDSNSGSDYVNIPPKVGSNPNEVIYDLPDSNQVPVDYYLYGNISNINSVSLDDKQVVLPKTSNKFIKLSPERIEGCCKNLVVKTKGELVAGGSYPMSWGTQPVFAPNVRELKPLSTPFLTISDSQVFLAPLPYFDPQESSHLQVGIRGNYNYPIGFSIIQADAETLNTRYIANYTIQDISKPITINYNGIVNPLTNIFESSQYYVGMYGMKLRDDTGSLVPYPRDIAYTADMLALFTEKIPYVFAITRGDTPKISQAGEIEYINIDPSLTVFKLPSNLTPESIVQLKNSYNAQWKLILIDSKHYEGLKGHRFSVANLLYLYSLTKSAANPLNIEYYSNGWRVAAEHSGKYAAVVFMPQLVQKLCYAVSMLFLSAMLGYLAVIWLKRVKSYLNTK